MYSLAFANGRLFASTDSGYVYGFSENGLGNKITSFNERKPSYSSFAMQEKYVNSDIRIVNGSGISLGYILIIDPQDGYLAYELATRTGLSVVCLESDILKIKSLRAFFDDAGLSLKGQVCFKEKAS